MNDRHTPETDTNVEDIGMGCHMVGADFSRRLERERDEAREAFVIATDQMVQAQCALRELERERDEARRQCLQWLEEWHLTDRARCDMKSERDEARSQRNALAASLEYIASAGLTAQHYEDEAKKMLALAFEKEGGV
jgi:hypothetical protein